MISSQVTSQGASHDMELCACKYNDKNMYCNSNIDINLRLLLFVTRKVELVFCRV